MLFNKRLPACHLVKEIKFIYIQRRNFLSFCVCTSILNLWSCHLMLILAEAIIHRDMEKSSGHSTQLNI
jgi:hypothetical protein